MSTETTKVATVEKNISTIVLNKINTFKESGELRLPSDYSPENALKSAYLILSETLDRNKKPVLTSCSQQSIANSLLKMVVYGLSPLKQQVYFVPYGGKLECTVAYTGNIAMAKRYAGLVDIKANCIMEGEDFEFKVNPATGRKELIKHVQTLASIGSSKIVGAYAIYTTDDGQSDMDVMTMEQIKTSWAQGASNGASPAHKKFPAEMAKKTVLNRAIKILLRSSDDSVLYDAIDKDDIDIVAEDVKHEVQENANKEVLDIDIDDAIIVSEEEDTDAENQKILDEELAKENPGF